MFINNRKLDFLEISKIMYDNLPIVDEMSSIEEITKHSLFLNETHVLFGISADILLPHFILTGIFKLVKVQIYKEVS